MLLGPCRQYQSTFLCGFVQIGLKYLKKPSFNHFSWQKHLQADTLQLQNQYLHAFFSPLIFQTVKSASWHKLLQSSLGAKLCPGLHLLKSKPVSNAAHFQCSKSSANPSNPTDTIPDTPVWHHRNSAPNQAMEAPTGNQALLPPTL